MLDRGSSFRGTLTQFSGRPARFDDVIHGVALEFHFLHGFCHHLVADFTDLSCHRLKFITLGRFEVLSVKQKQNV